MKPSASQKTGILYLLNVLVLSILLYVSVGKNTTPSANLLDTFQHFLLNAQWLRWLIGLVLISLVISLVYLSKVAEERNVAEILFLLSTILAFVSLFAVSWLAIFSFLPLLDSFQNFNRARV